MKTLITNLKHKLTNKQDVSKSIAKLQPKSELSQAKVYDADGGNITKAKLY